VAIGTHPDKTDRLDRCARRRLKIVEIDLAHDSTRFVRGTNYIGTRNLVNTEFPLKSIEASVGRA
jgi:hypothetical protein